MSKPQFFKKFFHAYYNKIKHHLLQFFKWSFISIVTGIIVGSFSTLFAFIMNIMTDYREQHDLIIFFLPLGASDIYNHNNNPYLRRISRTGGRRSSARRKYRQPDRAYPQAK